MKNFLKALLCLILCTNAASAKAFFDTIDSNPVLSYTRLNTFDKYRVSNPKIINDGSEYKMYYSGLSDQNKVQIGLATSPDGVAWSRYSQQPIFKCNENISDNCANGIGWSGYRVGIVDVVFNEGQYHMWYVGNSSNSGSNNYLGYASSPDGIEWMVNGDNPIFPEYASSLIEFQSVIYFKDKYYLYYRLNDNNETYLASSDDGITWVNENNAQSINPGYILSLGVHKDKVYGFVDGIFYSSKDAINFEKSVLPKVTDNPQVEGTMIFEEDLVKLWSTKGTGFEFGGFFNTVINYYTSNYGVFEDFFENGTELVTINLNQLRADGKTVVGQGQTVIGNALVFRASVENKEAGVEYALEVEVERVADGFDGQETFTTAFTEEGTISTKVRDFIKHQDLYSGNNRGDFKWRARIVGDDGSESAWEEFGEEGTDFSLRAVPLMTQQSSPYPSIEDTTAWSEKKYAFERSPECKNTIKGCGCALAALTTLARYYGITTGADGSSVNPDNLNAWLRSNNGYDGTDNIKFNEAIKYFGTRLGGGSFQSQLKIKTYQENRPNEIRNFVAANGPTVVNARLPDFTHFFVLDSLLDEGYEVSDPLWYNTDTSNDERSAVGVVQDYNDTINSARLIEFSETPAIVGRAFEVHIASPATLLITDAQGRKLGHDPRSGVSYNEIPTGEYWAEADISTEESTGPVHETKIATIIDPSASPYRVEVIGEAEGDYYLSIYTSEVGGESRLREYSATTSSGVVQSYTASYVDDQVYKDSALLGKFIAWLKVKLPKLPKGLQRPVSQFIAKYEPTVAAGNVKLSVFQRTVLRRWESRHGGDQGLEFVPLLVGGS